MHFAALLITNQSLRHATEDTPAATPGSENPDLGHPSIVNEPGKFIWHWDVPINVGQKLRVDYFPSSPESAAAFTKVD